MKTALTIIGALAFCGASLAATVSPAPEHTVYNRASVITASSIAGEYEWSYKGLLSGQTGQQYGKLTLSFKEGTDNVLLISGLVDYRYGFTDPEAILDVEAGTISIANNQVLGSEGQTKVFFYIKSLDAQGQLVAGASSATATVGRLTEEGILFPEQDVWAIGNPDAEGAGYYHLTYSNSLLPINRGDDRMLWEEYCMARFEDGWGMSGLSPDAVSQNSWNVSIQKSRTTDGLFRIHDPYMEYQCPLTSNYCGAGDIVFNVKRPDFVWVQPEVESGFLFSGLKLCYTNIEGFRYSQGDSVDEIRREITADGGTVSNYTNNVVTIHNCRFNYNGAFDRVSVWLDENGVSLAPKMIAVIRPTVALSDFQTSVESIEAANDAIVEYYSVDGVRLVEPKGICIRREGDKVSKIIVR